MRVTCDTVDHFMDNLKHDVANVFRKVVYLNRVEQPIAGEGIRPRDVVKWQIGIQVSTVINIPEDDGQFILELGYTCGIDYRDASQEFGGSDKAAQALERIKDFCECNGLSVRPGIVDM